MKYLIVAAHPDDELLGAGGLIRDHKVAGVVYPFTPESKRIDEALRMGDRFGYDVQFGEANPTLQYGLVLVPSPTDPHAEHQAALDWALQKYQVDLLREYSIEKFAPYVTPIDDDLLQWKRAVFLEHYPSQQGWLTDPKYFLFEGTAKLGVPSITVSFEDVGFHFWRNAPDSVAYLRNLHRHKFHVRVTLKNLHKQDREREFHLVQVNARGHFSNIVSRAAVDGWSCEEMARRLAVEMRVEYRTQTEVQVWEDGECGATVTV